MSEYLDIFEGIFIEGEGRCVIINGESYTANQFVKNAKKILVGIDNPKAESLLVMELKDEGKFKVEMRKLFKLFLEKHSVKKISEFVGAEPLFVKGVRDFYEEVVDYKTGVSYVFNRQTNRVIFDMSVKAMYAHFTKPELEELAEYRAKNVAHCVFKPRDTRSLYREEGKTYLNLYDAPYWRQHLDATKPQIFIDFLKHLFNDDKHQIKHVLGWMYNLIYGKNEVALSFIGNKGIGKNLFYEICKQMVSPVYCTEAPKAFGKKEFNDYLRNRLLIGVDEHPIRKGNYDTIKGYFNKFQTIEAKNQAVGFTEEIHVNFIFMHNSPSSLYLENSERRFSLMDVTNKKLRDVWGEAKVDEFVAEITDYKSDLICQIGTFITEFGKNYPLDPFAIYYGDKYEETVYYHLSPFLKGIIDIIEKDEVPDDGILDQDDVLRATRAFWSGGRDGKSPKIKGLTLRTLVEEYRFRNKYQLGEVLKPHGQWTFKVNPEVTTLIANEEKEDE